MVVGLVKKQNDQLLGIHARLFEVSAPGVQVLSELLLEHGGAHLRLLEGLADRPEDAVVAGLWEERCPLVPVGEAQRLLIGERALFVELRTLGHDGVGGPRAVDIDVLHQGQLGYEVPWRLVVVVPTVDIVPPADMHRGSFGELFVIDGERELGLKGTMFAVGVRRVKVIATARLGNEGCRIGACLGGGPVEGEPHLARAASGDDDLQMVSDFGWTEGIGDGFVLLGVRH